MPDKPIAPPKEVKLQVRIDDDLYQAAMQKAEGLGGLSAVVRALIRAWVAHRSPSDADVLAERVPAAYRRARKPRRKSAKRP
jgi:Arc/MetJ family transcription regulator